MITTIIKTNKTIQVQKRRLESHQNVNGGSTIKLLKLVFCIFQICCKDVSYNKQFLKINK